ncbi:MAG: hypothetical protein JF586_04835 [Burkholderiales bacterium]|nr:hypothetical protein [Burkholderiales bacterium]
MDAPAPSASPPWPWPGAPLPATYGAVLTPLDVTALPSALAVLHRDDALFRAWVHALDRTLRAEKVSSWTTWSVAELRAYGAGDTVAFSRLRGYTEAEIAGDRRDLELTRMLDAARPDDPDFSFCTLHDVLQTMCTPAFDALEAQLLALSDIAPPGRHP